MIVNGYNEMKPYLPAVEMKGTPSIFNDALAVAQDELVNEILGHDIESLLEDDMEKLHSKLLTLCQREISQSAFLKSIPELDLVLTDAGFAVVNNERVTMASRDRVEALRVSLAAKVDDAKDAVIAYLMKTESYDDWRGTEEFARLSDGLILTFAEFKDAAVLNNATAKTYPHSWSDFYNLNSALNVALMTDVASYISKDYAVEIIEKIRDRETFLPNEKKVLKLVKTAIAAHALGDARLGQEQAIAAATIMRANISDFPTFAASPEAKALELTHSDTPIFSLF